MEETQSFRPSYGQILTVAIAIIAVVSLVMSVSSVGDFARYLGPTLLIPALTWALFWRPSVDVGESGVIFRNIVRTVELPWAMIDWVDTKYALTLGVGDGKYTAWAVPAPGFIATRRAQRAEGRNLPKDTYEDGTIRPGDIASSLSGQAAMLIRRYLERQPPESGTQAVLQKSWNWDVITIVGVLAVWTAIAVLV